MSFFAEVAAALHFNESAIAGGYQIINFNGEAVYIEGFKRVVSIGETEILLGLKKGQLTVTGENLTVFSLENTTVIIKGKITKTEVTG